MASVAITAIIIIAGLIGLYYLYQYLFAANVPIINAISGAQPGNKIGPVTTSLPPLYQGGQFSISTWVYVSNVTSNHNDPIIVLGGTTYDTLRVYIGPGGQLCVRVSVSGAHLLTNDKVFKDLVTTYNPIPCDIPSIDMQRWVHIVVALNGSLCDVYMDGKLVRSCALANYFDVDSNPTLQITPGGTTESTTSRYRTIAGFNGVISTTNIYGIALSPDIVYSNYMAGPNPITNFYQYLASFFQPDPIQ
jgi:hypothetical protein